MNGVFRNFVEILWRNPDATMLRDAMEQVAFALDLGSFAYLHAARDNPTQFQLISNYPNDWTDLYLARDYEGCDPVVMSARTEPEPFEWGGGRWTRLLAKREDELMEEASLFGISYGFTFPIQDPASSFAALTFAADHCQERIRRPFALHRDLLKLIAYVFHAGARRTLAPARSVEGVILTYREFECLEWAAKGKSAWDTSQILSISRRTVTFHLHNAKLKLGVRTIQQAVALLAASRRTGN